MWKEETMKALVFEFYVKRPTWFPKKWGGACTTQEYGRAVDYKKNLNRKNKVCNSNPYTF